MIVLLFVLLVPADGASKKPDFTVKLRKSEDSFMTIHEAGGVVWKIRSNSGIGGVTVDLKSGDAPRQITIRFVGMENLESFTLRDGTVKLSTRLAKNNKRTLLFDARGDLVVDPKESIGSLTLDRKPKHVEVVLQTTKPGKRWIFSWVNEFR